MSKYVAYIGSYTYIGKSKGITIFDVDTEKATLRKREEVEVNNSAYILPSPDRKLLYSIADEGVVTFRVEKDGSLTRLGHATIRGMRGRYMDIDPTGRFLAVAGYHDGKTTVLRLNEDGTVAYEEVNDDGNVIYRLPERFLSSKEELVGYMVSKLSLTENDVVLIDRVTGVGQAILQNAGKARVGIMIHADHFSEGGTDDDYILWNNFYEYSFSMNRHIDFYVTSTDEQNQLLKEQFMKYNGVAPAIYTIPVGSLDELKYPTASRKPYSILTASRLATEKHVDWIIEAVVKARETVSQLSLDIYGKGGEEKNLQELIKKHGAESYIVLRGQQNLKEVYQDYELYLSGSTSEGFGLTLMEAVGGGLPIIGFDVRYGNPTFIDDGENGYLVPIDDDMTGRQKIEALADRLVRLFTEADLDSFHEHSYEKAKKFLTSEVEQRWRSLVG